ncbi:MAG: hypothetical protein CSA18_01470 [Deltaproteobacteria bacterium]|nr:MAG: hypothetical protein CSA18_01470 [Deltaproteobacteria bacterium]
MIIKENLKKNPRYLAVYILSNLESKNTLLDSLINKNESIINQNQPKDKALFFNIVYGVLRKRGNIDKIIKRNSNKPIEKIDLPVLNVLRTGIYQMVYLEKIPYSAAVNTSVDIVKTIGLKSASGFVNGILRSFSKNFDKKKYFKYEKNTADFPRWIIMRWKKRFGEKTTEKLCCFYNLAPPVTLRVNSVKTTKKEVTQMLLSCTENICQDKFAKDALKIQKPNTQIHNLPGFKKGFFQVQDAGAQIVTTLLNPLQNEKIMDACAGLGGKTGYIAQLTRGKAFITAVDSNSSKLEILKNEMLRLGFSNCVKTAVTDLSKKTEIFQNGFFDKILVDAPCSGLGVLRRNPDTKWKKKYKDLKECTKIQKKILGNCAGLVKRGGYLLYTVCSFEKEETSEIIDNFLKENVNFKKVMPDTAIPADFIDKNMDIILFPHKSQTDGFFASLLKKEKNQKND